MLFRSGLPVFTPDGGQLSWASGRTPDKKAQIFIADWDDSAARKLLGLGPAGAEPFLPLVVTSPGFYL